MFEVCFYRKGSYWNKFRFEFETIEEAQSFVSSAITHFAMKNEEDKDFVAEIVYSARYNVDGKLEEE